MQKEIKNRKAFSLIELSIVILVVGIVIAGVTQASRLVGAFKLSSARTLTQSSPVASIKGLILWLEPTSENSFKSSEADDENNITAWYDINPHATVKNNYTRGTSDNKITYEVSGTNSLPTLEFSGSTGTTSFLSGTATPTDGNAFTAFFVAKTNENTTGIYREIFSYSGWGFQKKDNGRRNISFFGINDCSDSVSWTLNAEIASVVYLGTTGSNTIKLYTNGAAKTVTPSTSAITTASTSAVSSNGTAWNGTISEIILFDRVLKISERQDVEAYLSKKYGIAVVQNN